MEKEGSEVDLIPPVSKIVLVLVGKFCTKRCVSLESVARVLKLVWRTEKNFEVYDMGENKVNQTSVIASNGYGAKKLLRNNERILVGSKLNEKENAREDNGLSGWAYIYSGQGNYGCGHKLTHSK
ncbi:hypothetical protein CFP56_015397 [Quercus suber]|uniref:Uncharacterized protein n=1 Tax=Quercus suber TaxID=58331 RepID=A0AAW0KS41_QUESU